MDSSQSHRLGLLSGVVFVVLVVVAFNLGGDTPELKDSAQKVAKFYSDHHDRQVAASLLLAIGALFGAVFAAHLWAALRSAGVTSAWSTLVAIGSAVAAGGFLAAAGIHLALAEAADKGYSPDQLRVLNALDMDTYVGFAGGLGMFVLGSGAALLKSGLFPRWLAWVAVALGILTFTPVGFFAFGLSGIWIIAASILLYLRVSPGKGSSPSVSASSAG